MRQQQRRLYHRDHGRGRLRVRNGHAAALRHRHHPAPPRARPRRSARHNVPRGVQLLRGGAGELLQPRDRPQPARGGPQRPLHDASGLPAAPPWWRPQDQAQGKGGDHPHHHHEPLGGHSGEREAAHRCNRQHCDCGEQVHGQRGALLRGRPPRGHQGARAQLDFHHRVLRAARAAPAARPRSGAPCRGD